MRRNPANIRDRDLIRAAEERGWVRSRTSGSHAIFAKPGWPYPLSIPIGVSKNGTKRAIIQQLQEADDAQAN